MTDAYHNAPNGDFIAAPTAPPTDHMRQHPMDGLIYRRGDERNSLGIVSLVSSLVGLFVLGIVFGHLGRSAAKRGLANNPGMCLAGLIIGYAQVALGIVWVFVLAILPLIAATA